MMKCVKSPVRIGFPSLAGVLAAAGLLVCTAAADERSAAPVTNLTKVAPERFDVHVSDLAGANVPTIEPWKTVRLDPAYRGAWIVLGDLTGDGVAEIVSARCGALGRDTHYTSSVVVQRLDGSVLWKWGNSDVPNKIWHDVACQIYDTDGDGSNEVIVGADERVVVLQGATGKELRAFAIPSGASDCITFCNLSGAERAEDMIVKTRYTQLWAYDRSGKLLWTVEKPGGYRTSHQPFPIDLDGDGRDEIIAGFAALNCDGALRWRFADEDVAGGHADSIRLFHDGDRPEDKRLLITHCGGNRMDMRDGNGKRLWSVTGLHFESVFFGQLDKTLPGRELVVDVAHQPWGSQPLLVLSENGRLLGRYTTMRSRQHRLVDWFGTGEDLVFCGQTRALLDAHGNIRARFATPMPEDALGPDNVPDAKNKPGNTFSYMIHLADVTGNGRPDLVVCTAPGTAVWIYRNDNGAKDLSPSRLTMPKNATLY